MVLSGREIAAVAFQLLVDSSRNNAQDACDSASEWVSGLSTIRRSWQISVSVCPPACGPAFLSPAYLASHPSKTTSHL